MSIEIDRRIPVGVCETQPLMVEGLRSVLAQSSVYRVSSGAPTLEEASRQIFGAPPRIMIIDKSFGMPAVLDWLARIRGRVPTLPVVWGTLMTESEALRLLKCGAKGILRKTAPPATVLACLDGVLSGSTWMEEALFREHHRNSASPAGLTVREQQVLALIEQGLRNKEIAQQLGIRPGTVKIHLKHIFEKTGIRGRYGLAISGLRNREFATALTA